MAAANPEAKAADVTKLLAERWKGMGADEKAEFVAAAEQDKERYARECAAAGVAPPLKPPPTALQLFATEMRSRAAAAAAQSGGKSPGKSPKGTAALPPGWRREQRVAEPSGRKYALYIGPAGEKLDSAAKAWRKHREAFPEAAADGDSGAGAAAAPSPMEVDGAPGPSPTPPPEDAAPEAAAAAPSPAPVDLSDAALEAAYAALGEAERARYEQSASVQKAAYDKLKAGQKKAEKAAAAAASAGDAAAEPKGPPMPKKPRTAYLLFANESREAVKAENPDELRQQYQCLSQGEGALSFGEVGKLLGEKWKALG